VIEEGAVGLGVTFTIGELGDCPTEFVAIIRKLYCVLFMSPLNVAVLIEEPYDTDDSPPPEEVCL
jgi:hypothetical protein